MSIFVETYRKLFVDEWPYWSGGIGLAVVALLLWISGQPWGVIGGYRNWGDWMLYWVNIYEQAPESILLNTKSLMAGGLILGAFSSALIARQFALRMPPWWELGKGVVGGAFMGFGAMLSGGCNVGGFFSNIAALSLSGILMLMGLIAGAVIGLKFLSWESDHIPTKILSSGVKTRPASEARKKIYPYLGWSLFVAAICSPALYARYYYTTSGMILMLGFFSGVVMHRSRFCFAAAIRDPFMTGEGEKVRALFLSLSIYILGVSLLKWRGFVPEGWYVFTSAGWGAIAGGLIFGIGMILAGGCATGTLFRVGEGQLKLLATLISMAVTNSLAKFFGHGITLGKKVFLPDLFGNWSMALVFTFIVLIVWVWFATWNEESEKCVLI